MKRTLPGCGDVIGIPFGSVWVLAHVIYESSYFRDLILLGVELVEVQEPAEMAFTRDLNAPTLFVYTGKRGIEKRRWRIVGTKEVSADELDHTLRVVGGGVWKGDEYLRPASEEDQRLLPVMDVFGHKAVEDRIAILLRGGVPPAV